MAGNFMVRAGSLLSLVAALLLPYAPARAAEDAGRPLASVAWLAQNLKQPELLLLDASPAQLYKAQHIPGAISADLFSFGVADAGAAEMQQRLQAWGVSPGKRIVVYDQGGTYFATKIFFDLLHWGYPLQDLAVLDGGLAKWRETGGAVTQEATPPPRPGTFRVTRAVDDIRARLPEFLVASGDPKRNALVEALEPSSHYGEAAFFDRAGHVPNAVMLPSEDFFNPDKTFKSAAEIERMAGYVGVTREQQIYTYCGGGIAASVPFFGLKVLANYPKVKLYQESQLEWLQDDRGLPFWTYSAPYLMRETAWLKGWGGKMARMYGIAKVSIVDVRPAQDYRQAHIPYSVNVPADVFRNHVNDPARLAELLGQAGVDASHEAVIVSEGGVNTESALAYVMLERLGQKRASLLLPSIDQWAAEGQPVTADPTVVSAAPGNPFAIAPKPWAAPARSGALIADPARTTGAYPKVYLASGKDLPARQPEGKVIHLPYTELVDAAGKPKPAKDIWKVLVKAGVPRYAEIVCFADTPGAAAANYLVLKLMGFPDVKVWAS